MPALSDFGDFVKDTGPAYLTGPKDIVNDAVYRGYSLERFLKGRDASEVLQGGARIKDVILFDEESTGRFYRPNDPQSYRNPQPQQELAVDWRFFLDEMTWTDQEVLLNGQSGTAKFHQYKAMKYGKEQRLHTSVMNFWERQLWAVPTLDMEQQGGLQSYSIPFFINEGTNGLFTGSGITTKQGLNPAVLTTGTGEAAWDATKATYDPGAGVTDADALISRMNTLCTKTKFMPPPSPQQYYENAMYYGQVIFTSELGLTEYKRAMLASQDTFVYEGRQDSGYNRPTNNGIEIMYVDYLDTAELYTNGSGGLVAEGDAAATNTGARYYAVNTNYLKMIFHSERYMYRHEYMRDVTQPTTWVMPHETWGNMFARSLRRQGLLSPA